MKLELKLGYLSFQNKIEIFKETYCIINNILSFPNVRIRTNALHEEAIVGHQVEDYKNTLQDYWRSSKSDLTICRS